MGKFRVATIVEVDSEDEARDFVDDGCRMLNTRVSDGIEFEVVDVEEVVEHEDGGG